MKINEAKETLRTYFEDYAEQHLKKGDNGAYYSPTHEEKTASFMIKQGEHYGTDFSDNNRHYDIFDLYAVLNGLDTKTDFIKIVKDLASIYHITIDESREYKKPQEIKKELEKKQEADKIDYTKYKSINDAESKEAKDYLLNRQIKESVLDRYKDKIYYSPYFESIIFKCSDNDFTYRAIKENENNKTRQKGHKGHVNLWNYENIKNAEEDATLYILESITDALTLESVREDAKTIALNSTANAKKLIEELKQNKYKGDIILLLDADDTGRKASDEIEKQLKENNIFCLKYNDSANCYFGNVDDENGDTDIKDLNELATKKPNDATELIEMILDGTKKEAEYLKIKNIKDNYTPTSEYIKDLENEITQTATYKPTPTGITELDKAINGGLFAKQLTLLVADTSIGKTGFSLQVADEIAKTKPVLYFSLEMSQSELIARSISRNMFIASQGLTTLFDYNTTALTTLDILQGKQYNSPELKTLYDNAKANYINQVKDNLYIYECVEDNTIESIEKRINDFIATTKQKPVVFIDYLQYARTEDDRSTDKQAIDKIIRTIKKVARKQAINIFVISSTARSNYNQETTLASAKESGDVEYTADVMIGLELAIIEELKKDKTKYTRNGGFSLDAQRQIKEERGRDKKRITLKILKNRNGRRDKQITGITYNAPCNYFNFNDAKYSYKAEEQQGK